MEFPNASQYETPPSYSGTRNRSQYNGREPEETPHGNPQQEEASLGFFSGFVLGAAATIFGFFYFLND